MYISSHVEAQNSGRYHNQQWKDPALEYMLRYVEICRSWWLAIFSTREIIYVIIKD